MAVAPLLLLLFSYYLEPLDAVWIESTPSQSFTPLESKTGFGTNDTLESDGETFFKNILTTLRLESISENLDLEDASDKSDYDLSKFFTDNHASKSEKVEELVQVAAANVHEVAAYSIMNEAMKGNNEKQKFFILAIQRSGSTWLSRLFSGHKEVLMHNGECLRTFRELHHCATRWKPSQDVQRSLTIHSNDFSKLLDMLFYGPSEWPERFVGMKWMVNQLPQNRIKEIANYISKNKIKIVSLKRKNVLRQCFSLFDMYQRHLKGVSVHDVEHGTGAKWKDEIKWKIPLQYWEHCFNWFGHQDSVREKLIGEVEKLVPGSVFQVEYSDLCTTPSKSFHQIEGFLDLHAHITLDSNFHKMHTQPLKNMVTNWNSVIPELVKHHGNDVRVWANEAECGGNTH
eukprot:jgi/Bigna1/144940/aug1.93_g19648